MHNNTALALWCRSMQTEQHAAADIPKLLFRLGEADLVVGARFAGVGSYTASPVRRVAIQLLSRLVSRHAGSTLTDVTSGFRATGRRGIEVFAEHYPIDYLSDTVESLVIAAGTGMRIIQVPVEMSPRREGDPASRRDDLLYTCYVHVRECQWEPVFLDPPRYSPRWLRRQAGDFCIRAGLVGAVACLALIVEMVRRRRLREKYAVLWIVVGISVVVGAAVPSLLSGASDLLGVQVPSNLVFFLGGLVLFVAHVQASYEIGRLEDKTRILAQELALLQLKVSQQGEQVHAINRP